MTSITSKEGRMRTRNVFLCHCKRGFATEAQLCRHTQMQHNQQVLALEGYITITSTVHRIIRSRSCHALPYGHQDHPIEILDSPLSHHQQEDPPSISQKIQPEMKMEIEEQREESAEAQEESEMKGQSGQQVEGGQQPATTDPLKIRKRLGRRPNFLIKVLQVPDVAMERCSWLLGRFISNQWEKQLPGLDFRQLMARANESKLCSQLCRFIAGWPIAQQDFTPASYRASRDRLLVLSLLPLGEEAFLKWRGAERVSQGEHSAFFNFFFLEFLPALLRQKRMRVWIRTNQAAVLLHKAAIHAEVMAFLRWWNHEMPLFSVYNHPAHDFTPLLLAENTLPVHTLPPAEMEEEEEHPDND